MSQDTLTLLQSTNTKTFEMQFVLQCAPVISGLKVSNLLILPKNQVSIAKRIAKRCGLKLIILLDRKNRVTMLLYRHNELLEYLNQANVWSFLRALGYEFDSLQAQLRLFCKRYQAYSNKQTSFPHEMGLFLGYPLEDVKGFIQNKGENCLYTGYWKVYHNVSETVGLFERFEQARELLIHLVFEGVEIVEIITNFNKWNPQKNYI